jgi:hypothetical protein
MPRLCDERQHSIAFIEPPGVESVTDSRSEGRGREQKTG